jgi:hypothetical protein
MNAPVIQSKTIRKKFNKAFSRVSVKALFALWLGGPVVLWSVFL